MADPMRGEIWLADLGSGRGHEQAGQRPVLVQLPFLRASSSARANSLSFPSRSSLMVFVWFWYEVFDAMMAARRLPDARPPSLKFVMLNVAGTQRVSSDSM